MVADDSRLRERFSELPKHLAQHRLLHLSAIILVAAVICHLIFAICSLIFAICALCAPTALIAHANTMCVIASHVAAFDCERPRIVKRAVTSDVEVVTRVLTKSTPLMIPLQLLHGVALRRPRVGAMNDDQFNPPRCSLQFRTQQAQQFRS